MAFKKMSKDADSARSAVLAYFPGQISHDSSNQYGPKVITGKNFPESYQKNWMPEFSPESQSIKFRGEVN